MHVVVRRCSLVLVNHNLSITALLREAECGPAAASAISLLTYKRKRWGGGGSASGTSGKSRVILHENGFFRLFYAISNID